MGWYSERILRVYEDYDECHRLMQLLLMIEVNATAAADNEINDEYIIDDDDHDVDNGHQWGRMNKKI